MLRLQDVALHYETKNGPVEAVGGVTLEISEGESVVFIGPSGCGKTSLIYLMAGLYTPTKGTVTFNNAAVRGPHPEMALILQDYGLLPWKTVWENITLGLTIRKVSRPRQAAIINPLLAELGLSGLEDRYPAQLSGGQRQRVGLARALSLSPSLLLMDEPLSALDALTREHLQNLLLQIWLRRRLTVVMVTHNIEEAVYLGKRIVVLSPRPAKVAAIAENPLVGSDDYRSQPEFYHQATYLRALLGSEQGD